MQAAVVTLKDEGDFSV